MNVELIAEFSKLAALASDEKKQKQKNVISHGAQSDNEDSLQLPAFCL